MNTTLQKDRSYCRLVLVLIFFGLGHVFSARAQMRQVYEDVLADNEIKKISFYSPSQGYVAFTRWIGYTTDSGRTFVKKYITTSNVNYNTYSVNLTFGFGIRGVKAFGVDTLLVYGNYGFVPAILYSTDQGNSFTLVYHSQVNAQHFTEGIMDMAFPQNTNIGFAVEADRIIKTTNRGKTWSIVLTSVNSFFDYIEPVSDNTIFTFSTEYNSKLVRTDNGGTNWQQMSIPAGQVQYAHFITPAKGWLNMNNSGEGMLYYTSNGGVNWTLKNDVTANPFVTRKMKFINDSTGYAVGGLYSVWKTIDSGRAWEPLPRDNNYTYLGYSHNDIHIWDKDQLWAGGGHGFLELSTNGGGTPFPKAYFKIETGYTSTVNLKNYSKRGYQCKWYVNDVLVSTSYNASYTHAIVSGRDSVKLVVTNGIYSDSITHYQNFNVPPLPTIAWVTPQSGSPGTMVTIYGNNFENISGVQFGGTNAASFTIVNATKIYAIVGAGATGSVSLAHAYGNFTWPGFTYFPTTTAPPPVITSFSPASGTIGTVVTITGNNFDPAPANNIVYFGDTRAQVSAAGANQITCTVPAGASYKPITVLNTVTHLSAQSFKPFVTTFADSVVNFTARSFSEAFTKEFPTYRSVKFATSADVDNDGRTDIVAAYSYSGSDSLYIYQNTTTNGNFSFVDRPINYMSGGSKGIIRTCDLDGDGLVDVFSAANAVEIPVFRNTSVPGNISFAAPMPVVMKPGMQEVIARDLDGDGKPDLIGTNYSSNSYITVVRNTSSPGNISFAQAINYAANLGVTVATGDLDNDGKSDIVALADNGMVSIFKNNSTPGNISFSPRTDIISIGTQLSATLMLVDMDGDDKLDIVSGNNNKIGRNTSTAGNFSFDFSYKAPTTAGYGGAVVESLNGDSRPDFVGGDNNVRQFDVFLNAAVPGSIVQVGPTTYGARHSAYSTHAADFNNDGKPDVLMTDWDTDGGIKLSIYKNMVGTPINFNTCSGRASLQADVSGSTYQWQQDNGSGFVNISDNSNFSGTTTSQLSLANVPGLDWNGFKYRCMVGGVYYSSTYKLSNRILPASDPVITATATSVCRGTNVTFTASDNNGRTILDYYWIWDGGHNVWTKTPAFTTYFDNTTPTVTMRLVAQYKDDCNVYTLDTSNVITITLLNGSAPAVTISSPVTTVCSGTAVTFTAAPVNGGDTPSYQWKVNGVNAGTNSAVFTSSTLTNNSQVSVVMTSSISCASPATATSNSIAVTVRNSVTPAISISASATGICPGTNVTFTATATNAGTAPVYQWKKNGQNVGANSATYNDNTLMNGDVIQVALTSNAECAVSNTATSNSITVQVDPMLTPSVTITGNTAVNPGQTTTLQATAANAGTAPAYQWQDSTATHSWAAIPSVTTASLVYTPAATGDKVRCQVTGNAPCSNQQAVMSAPLTFTVNTLTAVNPVPANSSLHIYPNPVTTTLVLDSLKLSDTWTTLEISDMNGRRVITQRISNQTKVEVWVAQLDKGMYVAVLRRKDGTAFFYKFLKM
jgi:hypothetical protein